MPRLAKPEHLSAARRPPCAALALWLVLLLGVPAAHAASPVPKQLAVQGMLSSPGGAPAADGAVYEYEPSEEAILDALLPRNLTVQIFRAMLESFASEQGARMTAMDSASRNAGDMIGQLSVQYNRMRQAQITKELIEIVSGAEAL